MKNFLKVLVITFVVVTLLYPTVFNPGIDYRYGGNIIERTIGWYTHESVGYFLIILIISLFASVIISGIIDIFFSKKTK